MKIKTSTIQNNLFEKNAWENSLFVCGIDEVGRGCFCGPVVTAAVILPINLNNSPRPSGHEIELINPKQNFLRDSKLMSEKERNFSYEWIKENCFYSFSSIDHNEIDQKNILEATKNSMKKSFVQLMELLPFSHEKIKYLIIDAVKLNIPNCYHHKDLKIFNPTKGESVSISVAAASIFAKVTRDKMMWKFAKYFPEFEMEKHKGYGTKIHQEALRKNGSSVIHRKSFLMNLKTVNNSESQISLTFGESSRVICECNEQIVSRDSERLVGITCNRNSFFQRSRSLDTPRKLGTRDDPPVVFKKESHEAKQQNLFGKKQLPKQLLF